MLTIGEWHCRYLIQARWTSEVRRYLITQFNLGRSNRILDVGCGTGVITKDLAMHIPAISFGLDIQLEGLLFARDYHPNTFYCCGDALSLPFDQGMFDLTFCHFLLLWLKSPIHSLKEMRRTTRSGGVIAALAEPDYGGRIDYPNSLAELGHLQTSALRSQGADPQTGRQLRHLFHEAGMINVEVGVLGGQWIDLSSEEEYLSEWNVINADLGNTLIEAQIKLYESMDKEARGNRSRILYVPTFYAWGKAP